MTSFVFNVKPTPKGRPRFTRLGRPYTDEKTRAATEQLRWMMVARKSYNKPLLCPLDVEIQFQLKRGKNVKREHPSVGADIDNYLKLVLDAANGILWKDDSQICRLVGEKIYGSDDRIIVTVSEFKTGTQDAID